VSSADTAVRGWRLLAVAGTVTALALLGHLLAGGSAPGAAALALLGVPVLIGSAVLARRRLRARTLLPFAAAAQLGLHHGLAWLSGPTTITPGTGHHTTVAVRTLLHAHPGAGPGTHPVDGGLMLAAHLLAAALTVALLLAVERGLIGLHRRWLALLPLLGGRLPSSPRRTPAPATRAVRHPAHSVTLGGRGLRGPPVALRTA
jgi:hypothetical protein